MAKKTGLSRREKLAISKQKKLARRLTTTYNRALKLAETMRLEGYGLSKRAENALDAEKIQKKLLEYTEGTRKLTEKDVKMYEKFTKRSTYTKGYYGKGATFMIPAETFGAKGIRPSSVVPASSATWVKGKVTKAKNEAKRKEKESERFDDLLEHIVSTIDETQEVKGGDWHTDSDVYKIKDYIDTKRATGEYYSDKTVQNIDQLLHNLRYVDSTDDQRMETMTSIMLELSPSGKVENTEIGNISTIGTPYEDGDSDLYG